MSRESSGRRWARIFKPDAKSEVEDELAFHFEQRVRDNIARGMDPIAARVAAKERLGDLKSVQRECTELLLAERRGERRSYLMKMSWLDFKLGFRMLAKYPGLTLVGGLAMAFAIWAGAGAFEFVTQITHPVLPLPDGDRIVGLTNYDVKISRKEDQLLHDFVSWRDNLETVDDIGAYRTVERNLAIPGRVTEPVTVAEVSASAFRVTQIPPHLGRTLLPADEAANATAVAVIGYEVWKQRFEGTADIIGRTVKLGSQQATIVGVMPPKYAFPIAHSLWVPLRLDPLQFERREGPSIGVFGRLADGASLSDAQAELETLGKRAAVDFPDTHEHLRPQVMHFPKSIFRLSTAQTLAVMSSNLVLIMLLVLICGNVALLMFARAATRETEITVRTALGASRGRIVAQLFAEALVLGTLAAILGLSAANFGMRWAMNTIVADLAQGFALPFWFDADLSPTTLVYAGLLTVLGAAISGVMPALKVTRGLQNKLRQSALGTGLSFGGIWTVVIVAQVAVTVAFPFTTFVVRQEGALVRDQVVGIPDHEYLTARLELDRDAATEALTELSAEEFSARYDANYLELERKLETDPAVASVTYASVLPRMYHRHDYVDVDAGGAAPLHPQWPHYRISSIKVDPDYFTALEVPILTGRNFLMSDVEPDNVVIVNESFVKRVLGGRNPIGRRVQYQEVGDEGLSNDQPWYEIIGVVRDLGNSIGTFDPKVAGIYHPSAPAAAYPIHLAVHLKGDPADFAPRLRQSSSAIDPALRLYDPRPLNQVTQSELRFFSFWFKLLLGVSAMALVLSLAGIYSVMAFTVSRRTREIGIRVALGSSPVPVIMAILRRPLIQVTFGILFGVAILTGMFILAGGFSIKSGGLVVVYGIVMMSICMLACVVPTRRALRIQPIDALKAD